MADQEASQPRMRLSRTASLIFSAVAFSTLAFFFRSLLSYAALPIIVVGLLTSIVELGFPPFIRFIGCLGSHNCTGPQSAVSISEKAPDRGPLTMRRIPPTITVGEVLPLSERTQLCGAEHTELSAPKATCTALSIGWKSLCPKSPYQQIKSGSCCISALLTISTKARQRRD